VIPAIVLAAGKSSRMGAPKATLALPGGDTFLTRIVRTFAAASVEDVVVVVGHDADAIVASFANVDVHARFVENPDYEQGQLSSLQTAIRLLEPDNECEGMLVHLVDHPYIDPDLVRVMLQRFAEVRPLIVVPRHQGKRGHPVLFSRGLFAELLAAPLEEGAKAVVNAHAGETLEIDTDEVGITLDIDTPELYRQHVKGE
jgi:molybdenum cofactor cytidylyltransferase